MQARTTCGGAVGTRSSCAPRSALVSRTHVHCRRRTFTGTAPRSLVGHVGHPSLRRQQYQGTRPSLRCFAVQAPAYEWSWSTAEGSSSQDASAFDEAHPIPTGPINLQEVLALFEAAAGSSTQPSPQWMERLCEAASPALPSMDASSACALLGHLSVLNYTPPDPWMASALAKPCSEPSQLSPAEISSLLWSMSNLKHSLEGFALKGILSAAQQQLEDFYGPDLCRLVCAVGTLCEEPDEQLTSALARECEYQLIEFAADFEAFDLARLATGLAAVGVAPTEKLQAALVKTVYMRTRTIEEKAAVDFALARLDSKGVKSMHYDPRWTHEELKWLPRRERDKRRMLKEGWYRTQWSGWRSGGP